MGLGDGDAPEGESLILVRRSKISLAVSQDMYTAVKNQQILQPLTGLGPHERQSMTLSPGVAGVSRTRSQRGQNGQGGDRITSLKRGSIRGLQSLLGSQSPYSSNSSVDGRISPSPSFATSIGEVCVLYLVKTESKL